MTRKLSILVVALTVMAAHSGELFAGSAVPVSISFTRHPEPKRRINWAAVNAASKQIDAAKAQLRQAANGARREVEATSEYESAVANLRAAQTAYQRAAAEASSSLELSHEYITLDLQLQSAVALVERLHDTPRVRPETITDAAHNVMRLRAKLTEMRKSVLANDANVEAARFALIDAGTELRRLRQDARSRVAQDPAWRSAREQLDAARRQYASAG